MAEVHERDIASLLRNDVKLVFEWQFFYYNLNLDRDDTPAIERSWNLSNCAFGLMRAIIGQFVSEKGQAATVRALADALDKTHHVFFRDKLLQAFPAEAKIVSFKGERNPGKNTGSDKVPDITKEDKLLQEKTSGGVTILQMVNNKIDGNGKLLVVISHLLAILSRIGNKPVALISINGKQRSGKSFLANQFIKYLKFRDEGDTAWLDKNLESDFEWRDDLERVTSGIQVWHEPLYAKFNGKEIGVIVMDTQGLHDKNTSSQGNSIIFGISVLLSSVFIYNEKHLADDSLQYLRTYLEYAKFATGGKNDGSPTPERLTFQKLIFLMRDFQTGGYKHGYYDDNTCPPDQTKNLKQSIFGLSADMHTEAKDTRSGIENCFEDRGVYAMSSPGLKLPNLAEFKQSKNWEPQFRSSVVDFVTKFFSPEALFASTKRVFGQVVTAEQLKAYVSKWVQLIQETEGTVGSKTIFDTTAEMFYNSKIEESLQEYKTKMKQNLDRHPTGIVQSELINYSSLLVTSVEANFCNDRYLGGAALLELYRNKLRGRLNGVKEEFYKLNKASIAAEKERQLREKEKN